MKQPINFATFVPKFDAILSRGLSCGVGNRDGMMCVEAAVCAALDLPHGDEPDCVAASVRSFKISLNDLGWSSPTARASGMRDLGIAQVGSLDVVDDTKFNDLLSEKIIRVLIPTLFREVFPENQRCLAAADACEREGTAAWAAWAASAARAASAAWAASAASAASAGSAARAAWAARVEATAQPDKYLRLAAKLALDVLRELKSPGCEYL